MREYWDSNQNRRTDVLLGLPHFLREHSSKFLKTCKPTEPEENLMVTEVSSGDALPKDMIGIALILVEQIVLHDLVDIPSLH
ncbi:hypothetical protein AAFF_G00154620 [Aldrovandia affinis]|uniref:Uncharacterized protein n=1 Tax=Aldrovandia affinis TaxID=143900 RepID=A0AAD7WXG5_9TELE|nr:hypothetical protein AAFF_G00154620 [Aldrovandia affinis]